MTHNKTLICPGCGSVNDGQTGLNCDHGPEPGNITICAYCCTVAIVEDDGETLRKLEEREIPLEVAPVLAKAKEFFKDRGFKRPAVN